MNKREIYDSIVAEVNEDINLIKPAVTTYEEAVHEGANKIALPENGVFLKTPISAFTDYAVRDCVMVKSMESEEFAFVLINKIGNTVQARMDSKTITQDDVEALATASQVTAMWEQFGVSKTFLSMADTCIAEYSLDKPTLADITEFIINKRAVFPFAQTRTQLIGELTEPTKEKLLS